MATRVQHLRRFRLVSFILFVLGSVPMSALYGDESAQYPEGFRRWVHVGTGVILPGSNPAFKTEEGMHHVFANEKAADGYASGEFPDGSIIVYELREAQQKSGVIFEGERKRVDVMVKDSSKYGSTGGWRFERFWGTDQAQDAVRDAGASCLECHSTARAHGFVFSRLQ